MVKLFLTENPMVAASYTRHDPQHQRVTVDEHNEGDLSLLAYKLEDTSAAGEEGGLADDRAGNGEGSNDTDTGLVVDELDATPWKQTPIEWELDFELGRSQAVESVAADVALEWDTESFDDEPELLDTDSDSADEVSERDWPPTPALRILDIVDLKFSSTNWDEMIDEDAESMGIGPVAPQESAKRVSAISIFDGLGTAIRGRSWEELYEEDEGVLEPKIRIFDGRGSRLTGPRWIEMAEVEDQRKAAKHTDLPLQVGNSLVDVF